MAFNILAAIENVQNAATIEPQPMTVEVIEAMDSVRRTDAQIVPASRPGRMEVWLPPVPPTRKIALPASERMAINEANGLRWGKRWAA